MANVSSTPKFSEMTYRIVSPLGTGAGSTILQISDKTAGGKRYALKVVKKQEPEDSIYIDQARNEFEVSRKLNHSAIAKIYDIKIKRSWFKVSGVELLMELVDGKTLDEIEAPEMGQLVLIFCQVASAINHMHRRGVYHGDLKPQNIMLDKNGKVKLIDFGTCWIRGREGNRAAGTVQYVAPEQAQDKVIDAKTDIYNFGATMYRMFTGRFANTGIPQVGDSKRKLATPIQINPKIPGTLNETILSCLEMSPERRPAGMFEIEHQLVAVAKYMGLRPDDLKGAEDDD